MFASQTQVSRTADIFAGYVIASHVSVHLFRAFLFASHSVPSFFAGSRAIGALPAPGADTTSGRGITRTIIHAFAMRVTILAVKTLQAFCFASNPSPVCLAVAMPGDGVTVHSILLHTVANLIASVPEEALFTTILAQRAGETSRTRARAILRIAGRIIETLAFALAVLAVRLVVAWTIAQYTDPSGRTIAPPILGRAGSSVLAGTHLRAILAEGVLWTQLAAILAAVSGRADASAVDGRTLRVILAVAVILAVLAIHVKGTRSGASLAVPSHLTRALPGPRMAQFCIVVLAFANLCAIAPVETIVASTLTAPFTYPARTAYAGAVTRIAGSIVFAGAIICAIQSERTRGTDLQTLVIVKAWLALALARHVMTTGTVIAIAGLRTVLAPETFRTSIRANRTRPARSTVALTGQGTASSTVLTTALRLAFFAVFTHRTQVVA